ncbi:MAG: cation transporter [Planctomycetes bacterium]|nr:cation transporter [Planctomycetota bacterium]
MTDDKSSSGTSITGVTLGVSVLLTAGLIAAYVLYHSQLALAQAADSFSDVFTSGVLALSVVVAARPQDVDHPFGHSRAEPLAALVAAVLAGVLAFTVVRSAIESLISGQQAKLDWPLVAVFSIKIAFKAAIMAAIYASLRRAKSPALRALLVDARNDVALNAIAVIGFFAALYGWPALDAWLALPTGLWIGFSGFKLARDNIKLLMGEAPPPQRQAELVALAKAIPGVKDAHDLRAQYIGTSLQAHLHILVDGALSVREGHDIGEAVRVRLEAEPDVSNVSVHVDGE